MQNLPEHNPQLFRQPLLKGKVKIRYVLLAGLWLATVAFFWHWSVDNSFQQILVTTFLFLG